MAYTMEDIRKSQEIFYYLLEKHELREEDEQALYKEWKEQLLSEHLPGKSPNPEGDTTNWEKSFETGKREV